MSALFCFERIGAQGLASEIQATERPAFNKKFKGSHRMLKTVPISEQFLGKQKFAENSG